jgi:hypothetical protein
MSGSSHAEHSYSRCVVSLDAGISISWAPDPDGRYEGGNLHHQREEAAFRARMQRAAAGIEVLLDEVEAAGHVFTMPGEPKFRETAQRASNGQIPNCELFVCCAPKLGEAALKELGRKVSDLVMKDEEPVPVEAPPEPPAVEQKPWWKVW